MTSRKAPFVIALIALAGFASLLAPAGSAAAPAAPAFQLSMTPNYANFVPSGSPYEAFDVYTIIATNVGGGPTSGPVTFTDTVPTGLTPWSAGGIDAIDAGSPAFPCTIAGQTVTCTMPRVMPPGEVAYVAIKVKPDSSLAIPTSFSDTATISGGGARTVSATAPVTVTPTPANFDFLPGPLGLGASLGEIDGTAPSQAGAHPGQLFVKLGFPTVPGNPSAVNGSYKAADGGLRDIRTYLPPGMIVNPAATPVRCTEAQLEVARCPDASAVGIATTQTVAVADPEPDQQALYNMVPPTGAAAAFSFNVEGAGIFPHILGGLRPGDYALSASVDDALARFSSPVFGSQIQLWGDPSSQAYDAERGGCAPLGHGDSLCPVTRQTTPFLTMPSACTSSLKIDAAADTWGHPGDFRTRSALLADPNGNLDEVGGCGALQFNPTLEARPTTNVGDSPSGLKVDLHIPQTNSLGTLATAHLRKAVVSLPEGIALNPSSANGLQGCSSTQIGIDPSTGVANGNEPSCPDASRIGDVEVDTPLLDHAVLGSVYVATPHDNPFGSLLAIYVVVDDPATGTLIKLAGHVEANPNTGQLVTTFDNNPQLPFTDFKLDFFGGPGAVLRTPSVCSIYETTSSLTPWSAPESGPPAAPKDEYAIRGNCSASESAQPNKPVLSAGSVSPIAGKYTPLVVHLKREDGSQQFKTLTLTPPPGLTAKLAGTPACSDSALASAAGKSGHDEQASPSCPSASRIGDVTVGAGAGPAPYYAKAKAYLAGPYKGAPLSIAIITPAVAGPYDLGTVVTRVALHVNPATTQITADADPIPAILQGIPLDVRSVDVSLDKPNFSRTGTSCDPFSVEGQLVSTLGQSTALKSRYQLGNCANLAFGPKLALRLKGGTKRAQNPALIATLTAKEDESNIASTAVTLPRSAFLDQSHIKTVCTRVQFAAGAGNGAECPAGSIYGAASARSPLLDYTLTGNAYLRSSSHKLPDLVIALHGPPSQPIAIELDGRTDSVKGALRNTFEAVPDAPVSSFRLELFGGKRGLVVNSRNLCANAYSADVRLIGQSGKAASRRPVVKTSCRKGGRKSHAR